jgi:hypothetical protein
LRPSAGRFLLPPGPVGVCAPALPVPQLIDPPMDGWHFGAPVAHRSGDRLILIVCPPLLLWLDVASLRTLVSRTDHITWEALVLLFGGFAVTFGGVVPAAAVTASSTDNDNPRCDLGLHPSDAPAHSAVDTRSSATRSHPGCVKRLRP